jgi:hypothetical protein
MKYPLILIMTIVFTGFFACKKMQTAEVNTAISTDESATMIATALSSNTNGLNNLVADIAVSSLKLYGNNSGCGAIGIDSGSRQSAPGAATFFSFKHKMVSTLNCNVNKLPENISSNIIFNGQCSGPKLATNGNGGAQVIVNGIGPASQSFAITGMLKNMCGFKMKTDTTRKGTIAVKIDLKNLNVSKLATGSPAMINSGSATATVTGNSPRGAFLFEGTLTFNGLNEATLTLSKEIYIINLITGGLTKK